MTQGSKISIVQTPFHKDDKIGNMVANARVPGKSELQSFWDINHRANTKWPPEIDSFGKSSDSWEYAWPVRIRITQGMTYVSVYGYRFLYQPDLGKLLDLPIINHEISGGPKETHMSYMGIPGVYLDGKSQQMMKDYLTLLIGA